MNRHVYFMINFSFPRWVHSGSTIKQRGFRFSLQRLMAENPDLDQLVGDYAASLRAAGKDAEAEVLESRLTD